ncbi:hypothetical protein CRUP_001368, partial [Coryphaenoides rupestris]
MTASESTPFPAAEDKVGEPEGADGERRLTNGGTFQHRELDNCLNNNNNNINGEDYGCDSGTGHFESDSGLLHHCELCSKTFKNPYSVKMHYRNVHLKEMHMCTVNGCNAAFPSRRSRDRHSANINLHHKLLTKDKYELSSPLYGPSPITRDRELSATGALEYCSEGQRDRDPLHRDPAGQASVIFRGHNRMGLVFPMSKMADPPSEHAEGEEGEAGLADDKTPGGGGAGGPHRGGPLQAGGGGGGGGGGTGGGMGSPITCHICHKVYSNKGTFRAHYKTVHLRLLHKCKVPGCDTSFSSVRSRNRHSQNPNLHRNLAVASGTPLLNQ